MKILTLLLTALPLLAQAQPDTLRPIRPEDLKPIETELLPAYYGRYGATVRSQYMYDGLDIEAKNLTPYIHASGDPVAIREFDTYISRRHTGGFMIAGGIVAAIVGTAIMGANRPDADGRFTTQQPITCPSGNFCGGSLTGGKAVQGTGQIIGYEPATDTRRQNAYAGGFLTLLTGGILGGIGWAMQYPGQHVRRAVQHYNRSLRQRQGVSWQLSPYSSGAPAGVGLVGRF